MISVRGDSLELRWRLWAVMRETFLLEHFPNLNQKILETNLRGLQRREPLPDSLVRRSWSPTHTDTTGFYFFFSLCWKKEMTVIINLVKQMICMSLKGCQVQHFSLQITFNKTIAVMFFFLLTELQDLLQISSLFMRFAGTEHVTVMPEWFPWCFSAAELWLR